MMTLQAPAHAPAYQVVIPNPQLSDQQALTSEVSLRRAIDGTVYTYVKRNTRKRLIWAFIMDRPKSLEFAAFLRANFGEAMLVTDHNGDVWVGHITSNPGEFSSDRRGAGRTPAPMSLRAEKVSINLEFEGIKQ